MALTLRVKIDCENDAFKEDSGELAYVLRHIAEIIEGGRITGQYQNVRDSNGNTCGTFRLLDEQED